MESGPCPNFDRVDATDPFSVRPYSDCGNRSRLAETVNIQSGPSTPWKRLRKPTLCVVAHFPAREPNEEWLIPG